jgi:hypothetical protein
MKYLISVASILFLLVCGCTQKVVKHSEEGNWYTTIENVDVQLSVEISEESVVTGGMELLEDAEGGELKKGTVIKMIEGVIENDKLKFVLDVDMDGEKSDEDIYLELELKNSETLSGFGYEVDGPDEKRYLTFTKTRK